jgi:hypothetical protein
MSKWAKIRLFSYLVDLTLRHRDHLMRHILQHRVDRLNIRDHLTELETNHWLLDQWLAEDVPVETPYVVPFPYVLLSRACLGK